jgi:hypothetical protein
MVHPRILGVNARRRDVPPAGPAGPGETGETLKMQRLIGIHSKLPTTRPVTHGTSSAPK